MMRKILLPVSIVFFMFVTHSIKAQTNIIKVISPAYCSDIKGNTKIDIQSLNFTKVTVQCWKQGTGFGTNSNIGEVKLNNKGRGSFVFHADRYPHGPITLRISGSGINADNCYLQLYNKGGISWNEGLPADPPAASGMKLIFSDDFNKALSIGNDSKSTYYDHKTPYGKQDFSTIPFTSFDKPNNPFSQVDSYLRIRASEQSKSAGLISSLKNDLTGIMASVPSYFECRFIAPNAIGTWPAFWLLTVNQPGENDCDELDIIEAYGGEGLKAPNAKYRYMITPHAWEQTGKAKEIAKNAFKSISPAHMNKAGIPSTWYETAHIYGCKITETETIYYCDNIEVGRHETLPISKIRPFYFLINLATGGGWPVDLSRYNGKVDMYVDYVRVYSGAKVKPGI